MEAYIVLPPKRAGIRQRSSSNQCLHFCSRAGVADQDRHELVGRRLLHQGHERLKRAEIELRRCIGSPGQAKAQIDGERRADARDQHPATNVRQKFAARMTVHGYDLRGER